MVEYIEEILASCHRVYFSSFGFCTAQETTIKTMPTYENSDKDISTEDASNLYLSQVLDYIEKSTDKSTPTAIKHQGRNILDLSHNVKNSTWFCPALDETNASNNFFAFSENKKQDVLYPQLPPENNLNGFTNHFPHYRLK